MKKDLTSVYFQLKLGPFPTIVNYINTDVKL